MAMFRPVQAGRLRKRVQIKAPPANPATNTFNEQTYADWTTVATVWCSIEPLAGRELFYAGEVTPDATHLVTIRYFRGLTTRHKFLHVDTQTGKNRFFEIENINDIEERHRRMEVLCHEAQ